MNKHSFYTYSWADKQLHSYKTCRKMYIFPHVRMLPCFTGFRPQHKIECTYAVIIPLLSQFSSQWNLAVACSAHAQTRNYSILFPYIVRFKGNNQIYFLFNYGNEKLLIQYFNRNYANYRTAHVEPAFLLECMQMWYSLYCDIGYFSCGIKGVV